ncbi:MAG TPA: ABC transporter substrate-binding protein [Acidimicrobiales bacterium]|nr:ABC transporter substrate-binding protein [Acidimicrobiales bacterium]
MTSGTRTHGTRKYGTRGMRSGPRRWAAAPAALLVALAAAACGLTPGAVSAIKKGGGVVAAGGGAGVGAGGSGAGAAAGAGGAGTGGAGSTGLAAGSGGALGDTGGAAAGGGSLGTGSAGGTTGGGTGGGTSGGTGGTAAPAGAPNAPYQRVGISATTIHLGLHAPQTGAAPVPLQAFATGSKLFWENHKLFGRQVVVDFQDDQYNPSVARSVCEQLSRQDFLILGGAGTDQIQACASDPVLASTHTPYLSAGVTTNGLTNLFNYFAISQTYAAQAPEVWTMASQLFSTQAKGKWAIVTEQTPNFNDVTAAMSQVLSQHHASYTVIRSPKVFQQSDASTAVSKAKQFGATTVFLDVDPNFWIDMVQGASQQLYTPAWVGPGITNGENLVGGPVCGEQPTVSAAFLSPYFALDRQPPGFTSQNNPPPDAAPAERDLEMLVYATNEAEYYMLNSLGSIDNLTRDNFIAAMPKFTATYGQQLDVLPTVSFKGGHFGGTGAWVEKLDCSKAQYVTVGTAPLSS